MTADEIIQRLISACHQAGGQRAFARRHGVSQTLVSLTISGKREPAEAVVNALGFVRRVEFVPVRGV